MWSWAPSPCWSADISSYNFIAAENPQEDESGSCCQGLGEGWKAMEVTRLGWWCHSTVQNLQACGLNPSPAAPSFCFFTRYWLFFIYWKSAFPDLWPQTVRGASVPLLPPSLYLDICPTLQNFQSHSLLLCCSNKPKMEYVKLSLSWTKKKKPQMVFDVNRGLKAERQHKSCIAINSHEEEFFFFPLGKIANKAAKGLSSLCGFGCSSRWQGWHIWGDSGDSQQPYTPQSCSSSPSSSARISQHCPPARGKPCR